MVAATSGAFIRLLTSFITSVLLDKCPTVLVVAEGFYKTRHIISTDVNLELNNYISKGIYSDC